MSKSGNGLPVVRLIGVLALSLALACGVASTSQAAGPTSPQDRARLVSITHTLEANPLDPALESDRKWGLQLVTVAPDIKVAVCLDMLGDSRRKGYPYADAILIQYIFSMASLTIEHPETADDDDAQQVAGMEGALKVYSAILKVRPDARLDGFDALLAAQAAGTLPEKVKAIAAKCRSR